jgi:hypothetical protein
MHPFKTSLRHVQVTVFYENGICLSFLAGATYEVSRYAQDNYPLAAPAYIMVREVPGADETKEQDTLPLLMAGPWNRMRYLL